MNNVCVVCDESIPSAFVICERCALAPGRPLCPQDVPAQIWEAVASQYEADWSPAPNYHVEYRDCREAYKATIAFLSDFPFNGSNLRDGDEVSNSS